MIPSLPFDAALPNLGLLLDEDAVTEMLADTILDSDYSGIIGCRPRYIRYKPETSCLVQYDIDFTDSKGHGTTIGAHIWIYADDRGQRRVTSHRMQRLVERSATVHHHVPIQPVAYLPGINGLLQMHPIDYDLPALGRTSEASSVKRVFREAHQDFRRAKLQAEPELIRYKPGRKALFRYDLEHATVETVYGKLRSDKLAVPLRDQISALIDAGVPTPPVLFVNTR
ncbi:MAG: hypothetical protein M3451_06390, partial [Chloroflexota bacterium]|nr:hypothetical protein [Chloroflexota bacterium]